ALKERNNYLRYFALSMLSSNLILLSRSDAPRSARRLPLAIILRAFGAARPISNPSDTCRQALRGLNARRLAIAFVEGPRLVETSGGTRYRTVILVDPLVVLNHFVHQSCLFSTFVFGKSVEIA